jgi:hypothetical protein
LTPVAKRIAAILAPYFSGLLDAQSDFGHPAGGCRGDMIVSDFIPFRNFSQNLACGADRSFARGEQGRDFASSQTCRHRD